MEEITGGSPGAPRLDERPLAEHAQRFVEIAGDLLAILDMEGAMVWANESWERVLGVPRDEILGEGYWGLVHPDDLGRAIELMEKSINERVVLTNFECRHRASDGSYHVLLWSTTVDSELGLIYATAKDITDQKRSRDELAASRRRLAEAQQISRLGGWTFDPETGVVHWSDELYRVFRIDPAQYEPSYEGHLAFVHPEDVDRLERALKRLWLTGEAYAFDYRVIVGDGEVRTLFSRAQIERREEGAKYIAGVCQDVTEAREAEAELARSVAIHRTILDATADAIMVTDLDRETVSWNRNFAELWRIPEKALEAHDSETINAIVIGQVRDPDAFLERITELYSNPEQVGFDILELKDGRTWERYTAPHRLDGEVVGRVWSFRDITARLQAERQKIELETRLQQSQRLESLGRLAGGIAHDFNNHLVAILNYATDAGEALPEGSASRSDLDEVIRAAQRASTLTRELVAFSRQEMVEPRPMILNSLVADTERLLRRTIGEHVELRVELGPDLPAIEADPSQLERVLVNLAVNARDAMPDGGALEISTKSIEVDNREAEGLSGQLVRLSVRDEGAGMSADVAERALEPFFTTKPSGEGTGLGLATVYGIVNQSGGQLTIDSAPGRGTTLTIDFPATTETPRAPSPRPDLVQEPAGGSVLVVEDEEPVRRITARILRDAGYRTIEAEEGEEALALLEARENEDLTLLVTDIVMPKMSGRELTERVREGRPGLPVLFMSGYTDDVVVRHGVATADYSFLAKPFNRETLLAAVAKAIKAGPNALS